MTTLIAVINFRGAAATTDCVRSLLELEDAPFSILVVDNSDSSTASRELLSTLTAQLAGSYGPTERSAVGADSLWTFAYHLPAPKLQVAVLEANYGYGAACNWAVWHAIREGATYAWLLNNDLVVDRRALGELRKAMQTRPHVAVLGASTYSLPRPDLLVSIGAARFSRLLARSTTIRTGVTNPVVFRSTRFAADPYVAGAAMFVCLKPLAEIGGFDETYFLYCEEVDLCRRLTKAGYSLGVVPGAHVYHVGGLSTKSTTNKSVLTAYCSARSAMICMRHHWPVWLPIAATARVAVSILLLMRGIDVGRASLSGVVDGLLRRPARIYRYRDTL